MRNIEIQEAKSLKIGQHILKPQHPNGILLAKRITSTEVIDGGKRVEVGTEDGILHVLEVKDAVAVI